MSDSEDEVLMIPEEFKRGEKVLWADLTYNQQQQPALDLQDSKILLELMDDNNKSALYLSIDTQTQYMTLGSAYRPVGKNTINNLHWFIVKTLKQVLAFMSIEN